MSKHLTENTDSKKTEKTPYSHCLNCGTELNGKYCHECGQEASDPTPSVGGFIIEYLSNAFLWDQKLLPTLWKLVSKPGFLTNSYNSGKFVAYEHPIKLNMFILFVFITLFLLFSDTDKMKDSVHKLTTSEEVFPSLAMSFLSEDAEYSDKMKSSSRDTVSLFAPTYIAEAFPEYLTCIKVLEDNEGEAADRWIAALPSVLIEDQVIILNPDSTYHFNPSSELVIETSDLNLMNTIWEEMVNMTTKYFPMLVLFTAPFLSFAVQLVYRKKKLPYINHFIFALHYTAFIELLLTLIYVIHLTYAPADFLMKWVMTIGSLSYLILTTRNVYDKDSWFKAIGKGLIINFTYLMIGFIVFFGIFIASCVVVGDQAG